MSDENRNPIENIAAILEQAKEQHERAHMQTEADVHRVKDFFLGLSVEEMKSVHLILTTISSADKPGEACNWYEGVLAGIELMKKEQLGVPFDADIEEWMARAEADDEVY